jgi:phosphatidylglycerophosphatase A
MPRWIVRGIVRWVVRGIGTFGFIGHLPLAPGTWASAATLALWLVLPPAGLGLSIVGMILLIGVGTWTAHRLEADYGHDDHRVVIDEVAGSLIAVAGLPPHLSIAIIAFALFRFFDIVKPPPIYQIQAMPGGIGVMIDDVLAGIFSNVVLRLLLAWNPGGFLAAS